MTVNRLLDLQAASDDPIRVYTVTASKGRKYGWITGREYIGQTCYVKMKWDDGQTWGTRPKHLVEV